MSYSIYVISNKAEKFPAIKQSMTPERVNFFDGTSYPSFAKLVNTCVAYAPTESVIIIGDKALPTKKNLEKMLSLLDVGYGFVGLYRFGFFGLTKELFRRIGFLDERFIGGGFEDYDFYCRLVEANIAAYITEEIAYTQGPSSWNYSQSMLWWPTKWTHVWENGNPIPLSLTRAEKEQLYDYNLGPSTGTTFLPLTNSYICHSPHVSPFFTRIKIKNV